MDEATLRSIIRSELRNKDNIDIIAKELFDADVMDAPDVALTEDPANKTWRMRSYLNRLINNTTPKTEVPK